MGIQKSFYIALLSYENISYNFECPKYLNLYITKDKNINNDNETYLWHLRLRYINLDRINMLIKDGLFKRTNYWFTPCL